jgi:hypothetical protein
MFLLQVQLSRNDLRKIRTVVSNFISTGAGWGISEKLGISLKLGMEISLSPSSSHCSGIYGS